MMLYHQTPCDRGVFFFFDVIVKLVLILAVANSEQQERTDGGKSNQAANALYPRGSTIDPSSYSNVERFQPNHISFDSLVIDFDTYTIAGTVTHTLTSLDSNASIMYMDVWDGIDLHSAKFRTQSNATNTSHSSTNYSKWTDVPFDITTPNPNIGNSIDIMLPISIPKGDAVYIRFEYTTISNGSLALYWTLPDYLTSDDDNSMMIGDTINNTGMIMYSLCQMNNCRDFAPMMDTPSQKVTYNASVIVPTAYNGVYMSANKTSVRTYNNTHTMYTFESTIPIPTYLIAIVVGSNTQEHFLNDRISIIASDSQTLESALTAFNDLPKVFDIVEEYLKIPYFWGNYSVFIMPSSFPTEGMVCLCRITMLDNRSWFRSFDHMMSVFCHVLCCMFLMWDFLLTQKYFCHSC